MWLISTVGQQQLTNLGEQPVEMVTRKLREDTDERGMLIYGYKFRPVLQG